ncbi:MAG: four helix bundle protein [Breznakibacter sp.]|nr:four helix bundle protein [Breznakibacter sp.]
MQNAVLDLSFAFALRIIEYTELLEEHRRFVIAKQLLRSGTSIGANINEAQNAESKADFIHKLKISAKEANETEYWLKLCSQAKAYPDPTDLLEQLLAIQKLLSKIIHSTKLNTHETK